MHSASAGLELQRTRVNRIAFSSTPTWSEKLLRPLAHNGIVRSEFSGHRVEEASSVHGTPPLLQQFVLDLLRRVHW
jgi:hypothetical protein